MLLVTVVIVAIAVNIVLIRAHWGDWHGSTWKPTAGVLKDPGLYVLLVAGCAFVVAGFFTLADERPGFQTRRFGVVAVEDAAIATWIAAAIMFEMTILKYFGRV